MMLDRRTFLLASGAALASSGASARAVLGDDGLYSFDWYLQSFLDFRDDIETAHSNGKQVAVLWGQRACPFCKTMHETYMADANVEQYVNHHFEIVHLDLLGARDVTDADGVARPEKSFAVENAIRFTPTIQFLSPAATGRAGVSIRSLEVARMTGLLKQEQFLKFFQYVVARGYDKASFSEWIGKQRS